MEAPKDYYELNYTRRDIDDAKVNGFLMGAGCTAVIFFVLLFVAKILPIA